MTRKPISRRLASALVFVVIGVGAADALVATTADSIRVQATQALGAPAASVEVSTSTYLLTISRIDSALNTSSHAARGKEAERIAVAIGESIQGLPEGSKIVSIQVDYIKRSGAGGHDLLVDRVEFRKNAAGLFALHVS